mgnify:CR=1 FL=1
MRITLKKVISFLCCMVPFGAPAADYPGGLAIGENTDSVAVPGTDNVLNLGENGLSVYGYTIIGEASQGGKGQLYAEQTSGTFTIQSAGNVSVGGLIVKDNALLGIKGTTDSNIDLGLGTVTADGGLQIDEHIGTVTATGITAKKMLSITANSADLGTVIVGGADASLMLDVNGMLKMNDFKYTGTANNTGTIMAGDIRVDGSIQNLVDSVSGASGVLNITANDAHIGTNGDIEVQGNIDNTTTSMMTISGGAITVNGTMSNQETGGTLKIYSRANLSVLGTDAGGVSFVNKGDFYGNVSGTTTFVHGVDLSGMTSSNSFVLTTGSLDLGTMRNLQLTHGTLDITTTSNSALSFATVANETDGKVKINSAGNFTAETLKNNSEMEIGAVDLTADELVVGNVAKTTLSATNALTLNGDISSAGTTMLTGGNITLQNVTNTGTMTIKSPTDTAGQISIAGNLASSGNAHTVLHTRQIRVTGNITNSDNAVTEILGSDTAGGDIQLGQLVVSGGTLNLKSLTGGVAASSVSLTGGAITADSVTRSITATNNVEIAGNLSATGAVATSGGDMSVGATGTPFVLASTGGDITIGGNVSAGGDDTARAMQLNAKNINVTGRVAALKNGTLIFGTDANQNLNVIGDVDTANGTIEVYAGNATAASWAGYVGNLILHGGNITARTGNIDFSSGLVFNDSVLTQPAQGVWVKDGTELTLITETPDDGNIMLGALNLGSGKTLTMNSGAKIISVTGDYKTNGTLNINATDATFTGGDMTNGGELNASVANMWDAGNITNTGTANITADTATFGDVDNQSGTFNLNGTNGVTAANVKSGGTMNVSSTGAVALAGLTVSGGRTTIASPNVTVENSVNVTGDLIQGAASTNGLNLTQNGTFTAQNLTVSGDLAANSGAVDYMIASDATITGNINVANDTEIQLIANKISGHDVVNNGAMTLGGATSVNNFTNDGTAILRGESLGVTNTFNATNLYQKFTGALNAGDVNIDADSYRISATDFSLDGNLDATNLTVFAVPATHLNANIAGNLSGGVAFANLGQMHVGGDYAFTDTSKVFANISNKSSMAGLPNYWSSVSLADDTLGQITNATSGDGALITVDGKFTSDLSLGLTPSGGIGGGASDQIGIALRELADAGDAIWLVYAQGGITESGDKLRNLNVVICNASGSICYDYFDGTPAGNSSAYLTMRDTDGNGTSDSIYVVFDPRFGGPVELFKIQPIVARNAEHTDGEYVSAGALDNMIAGQMAKQGFTGRHAIELLPVLFRGTNMETMANELYGRMEHYNTYRDSAPLSRFSRLFQAREIEQVAGSVILNEHTSARSFEDHMLDEFIWNRNRNLKKAWVDAEYGMLFQKVSDGKHADGNRFNITGGFDWQHTNTLILGLAGRVSHTSTDVSDAMNLGYTTENPFVAGHVDAKVANTNIGLGGYLMQTLGEKTRAYGNAFLDLHVFDITRHQTFVNGTIDGSGTAFALNTEWGLLHDWLNQYIVGNMYARAGYNFGFSVTEKVGGHDYMKMKSDGYLSFTPGYSLTAQKRIYPSVWFQVRPYATIGVEYDVLGAPDNAKYKFATAKKFTSYDIDIDPLWANIGGGVEMLSATGFQVGLDYRYQYNQDIQLHNIKVSGSYRF